MLSFPLAKLAPSREASPTRDVLRAHVATLMDRLPELPVAVRLGLPAALNATSDEHAQHLVVALIAAVDALVIELDAAGVDVTALEDAAAAMRASWGASGA